MGLRIHSILKSIRSKPFKNDDYRKAEGDFRMYNLKKEMVIAGIISAILSAAFCFVIVYFLIPVPMGRVDNGIGNAISGILSGAFSGAVSTAIAYSKLRSI